MEFTSCPSCSNRPHRRGGPALVAGLVGVGLLLTIGSLLQLLHLFYLLGLTEPTLLPIGMLGSWLAAGAVALAALVVLEPALTVLHEAIAALLVLQLPVLCLCPSQLEGSPQTAPGALLRPPRFPC